MDVLKALKIEETDTIEVSGFSEIKPETEMKPGEAEEFWNSVFAEYQEKNEGYYTSYDDRMDRTPSEDSELGTWSGERGESKFTPDGNTEKGKAALDKMLEYGLDGIEYRNGEPDFSGCSESTVEIDDMTENRYDYVDENNEYKSGNFTQADGKCAEAWNEEGRDGKTDWTARDVYEWRKENNYSWHECCDTKTMQLVPREIHEMCKHSGGVAECKARDNINSRGVFDE